MSHETPTDSESDVDFATHLKGTKGCRCFRSPSKLEYWLAGTSSFVTKPTQCQFCHENKDGVLKQCQNRSQIGACHVIDNRTGNRGFVPGCNSCNSVQAHERFGGSMRYTPGSFVSTGERCGCGTRVENDKIHDAVGRDEEKKKGRKR